MKKIITCASYHGTGSSVIGDILNGFSQIENLGEEEYRFLQDPNGVGDLEDKILINNSRLNSDRAIYEFKKFIDILANTRGIFFWKKNIYEKTFNYKFKKITNKFIKDIVDVEWNGYWHDFERRSVLKKYKILFFQILCWIIRKSFKVEEKKCRKELYLKEKMYFSYPIDNFNEKVKKYLTELFEAIGTDKDIIYFDQLVPCFNISKYLKYFENIKVIVVDRDPRDVFILSKMIWKDQVLPVEDVDIFIKHFKLLRKNQREIEKNILYVKFEDFIYKHEITLEKVFKFLGLDENEYKKEKTKFHPNKSINNTQLFYEFPELTNDIKKIEKELQEYCYEFPYRLQKRNDKIF